MTAPTAVAERPGATTPSGEPPPSATRSTRPPGELLRRVRVPVLVVVGLVLVAVAVALFGDASRGGTLDPRSAKPAGTRALATLLHARDVQVRRTGSAGDALATATGAGGPGTVVAAFPDRLTPGELGELTGVARQGGDLVLVEPSTDVLRAAATGLRRDSTAGSKPRLPSCPFPAAVTAGAAGLAGNTYAGAGSPAGLGAGGDFPAGVVACYPAAGGDAGLVVLPLGTGRIVVLGSADVLTNARLDQQGNAALSLGLLDRHSEVQWLAPASGRRAAVGSRQSLIDLLPDNVAIAILQLLVAVVFLGLWRARRFGRPVREPLPVVVRSAEAVEGRARLYGAARARGTAAAAMRTGLRARLAAVVGLGGAADPDPRTLVAAVADRTGRPPSEVGSLLYGSAATVGQPADAGATPGPADGGTPPGVPAGGPADDSELIRLADDLDRLDRQVRRP